MSKSYKRSRISNVYGSNARESPHDHTISILHVSYKKFRLSHCLISQYHIRTPRRDPSTFWRGRTDTRQQQRLSTTSTSAPTTLEQLRSSPSRPFFLLSPRFGSGSGGRGRKQHTTPSSSALTILHADDPLAPAALFTFTDALKARRERVITPTLHGRRYGRTWDRERRTWEVRVPEWEWDGVAAYIAWPR
jgi:hypothetical protein